MRRLIWGKANPDIIIIRPFPQLLLQRYPDFYINRKDDIEKNLLEMQGFDDAMLVAAIELGLSKAGQNCRYLSWEKLDREALISCARGLGAPALANFCRVVCRGARRAGLPDLMLWRSVDGMQPYLSSITSHIFHSRSVFCPSCRSKRTARLGSGRTKVCDACLHFYQTSHQFHPHHISSISSSSHLINFILIRYWMHQLQCCGVAVELLRVKEPQEVSQQSVKLARRKSEKRGRLCASVAVKPSCRNSSDIVVISSDDDIFEK